MVVIGLPTAADTGTTQLRIGLPAICTVQAPHSDWPQPYLVPVSPRKSRITHNRGMSGSTCTVWVTPLTVSSCFTRVDFRCTSAVSCKKSAHAAHHDHLRHALLAHRARSAPA